MNLMDRIESALMAALSSTEASPCPPKLANALHAAVFPGGHRLRPRLALSCAMACGDRDPAAADAAAAAIELLHCGSLVHDDLPCFDDADLRRGLPSIHVAFGEPIAVLVGDTLIVSAFETIARGMTKAPHRIAPMIRVIAEATGAPHGICAGQAWESEQVAPLKTYHRAKTGALFAAATAAGALASGGDPAAWKDLGWRLGEAYQVADDIKDVALSPAAMGKPAGQDEIHGRPNAARELGLEGAVRHLKGMMAGVVDSIPACPGREHLVAAIRAETNRFLPAGLAQASA
ncbi:MAG: polyprenyl synthetase family protein [Beijerinckiaceae bacterium]